MAETRAVCTHCGTASYWRHTPQEESAWKCAACGAECFYSPTTGTISAHWTLRNPEEAPPHA